MKKINLLLIIAAAFWLVAGDLIEQRVFAADPNCQNGYISNIYNNNPPPRFSKNPVSREQRQFAAAQTRNERNQPPGAGILRGGDTETRSNLSFFSSLFVLLGGVWALFVLLHGRFGKRLKSNRPRLPKIYGFAFEPSFALSMFGLLFAGTIAVSLLTEPATVGAKKRDRSKAQMTGVFNPSNKPVFISAQQIGGDETTQIGAPVFDADGNRYVRGTFTRSLPIGEQTLQESKFFDLFVAKYAPDGTALWARQGIGATTEINAPGTAVEGATALAVDADGNVYLGGSFVKKLILQGSAPGQNITLTDDNLAGLNYESFVAKYDADGNLLWARGGDSGSPKNKNNLETGQNAIGQIVLDSTGNPYITGFIAGERFFGTTTTVSGKTDILLAKLNPANGDVVWKEIIGGIEDDNALDLKIDSANNLYMIGNFASPELIFPDGETFGNLNNQDGNKESTNAFIAKFTSDGNTLWAKNLDNENTLGGSQIAVNTVGEIFLTGYYFDTAIFGKTVLTESEGSGEDEDALGGYVTKLNTDGDFIWAQGFGGIGKAISLDAAGRVYVVGTFWDGGTFGAEKPNEEMLASFGGVDLFVARYDTDGGFDWAKPIAGSDLEGGIDIGNPSDKDGTTENAYNPLGIAYNPETETMFVSGDFRGALSLDCQTLQTPNARSRHSYLAELSADNQPTSCRIWNGLDEDDNDFDSPDNWNGSILPAMNDSVYVPYTGNNFDAPDFNPAMNISLTNLVIADDRILTLEKDLNVTTRLDLLGGFIDAGDFTVSLNAFAEALSINEGRVVGRVQKQFFFSDSFTFPVGTENGYSPVTLSNINSGKGGSFTVIANEGAYPNMATDLPANRAARWWNLTNGGLVQADLTFQYLAGDITTGTETDYRAYRIPTGGGAAMQVNSSINPTTKTVTALNVTTFSDWTLAQAAATAASVSIGGRITTADGIGIGKAKVMMTLTDGTVRTAMSNAFGYYHFAEVAAGQTVVVAVRHKRYGFAPQVVSVTAAISELNFAAQ